ncbi:hypothetical protein WMY93_028639 [Mugilogobius chulae]|uniref:Dynein light chain Tctex-type 3 n=1 Tax=Mugilogobius chulae TaxID=88201 RepID=A0AAW0MQT6_9GOBI
MRLCACYSLFKTIEVVALCLGFFITNQVCPKLTGFFKNLRKTELIMEEYNSGEEVLFNSDEASAPVKENKVNQWTASIVEHCLSHFVKQGRAFKYIVNCTIMQKSSAGLHTANSCFWDTATDGSCTVRWENRTMYCVVSVFAVAVA